MIEITLLSYKSIISSQKKKKKSIIDMIFYRAQITKNHINCEKKKIPEKIVKNIG